MKRRVDWNPQHARARGWRRGTQAMPRPARIWFATPRSPPAQSRRPCSPVVHPRRLEVHHERVEQTEGVGQVPVDDVRRGHVLPLAGQLDAAAAAVSRQLGAQRGERRFGRRRGARELLQVAGVEDKARAEAALRRPSAASAKREAHASDAVPRVARSGGHVADVPPSTSTGRRARAPRALPAAFPATAPARRAPARRGRQCARRSGARSSVRCRRGRREPPGTRAPGRGAEGTRLGEPSARSLTSAAAPASRASSARTSLSADNVSPPPLLRRPIRSTRPRRRRPAADRARVARAGSEPKPRAQLPSARSPRPRRRTRRGRAGRT